MAEHHDVHSDSGKVTVSRNDPPPDYYYHDQGTTGDTTGPGPFHGDYGAPIPYTDPNPYGDLPESYVYPNDAHKDGPYNLEQMKRDAVNVRIVDEVPKDRTVRYQTLTVTVAVGTCVSILGRDPTRLRVIIYNTVSANKDYLAKESISNAIEGFQIPPYATGGLEIKSEDAIFILADAGNSSPSNISVYAEYVRSDNSRAETYSPE